MSGSNIFIYKTKKSPNTPLVAWTTMEQTNHGNGSHVGNGSIAMDSDKSYKDALIGYANKGLQYIYNTK